MAPALLFVRAELRRRRLSLALLAVIVAVVTATLLATVAGARRTSTVLDRFLATTAAHDLHVAVLSPEFPLDPGRVDALRQKLARIPGVDTVSAISIAAIGTQYDFGIMASPDGAYFHEIDRPIVVAGRLPAADAVDEIAINETAARQRGLAVGDVFRGPTFEPATAAALLSQDATSSEPDGPTVSAKVVGVVRLGDELSIRPQAVHPGAIASPAFFRANADRVGFGVAHYALRVDRSAVGFYDVLAVVREDVGDEHESFASWIEDEYVGEARGAYRSLVAGLLVFAAVAGVVGLLTILQAANRHIATAADADRVLGGMGMTRRQRMISLSGPSAVAVGAGVAGGLIGAVALSPWFPLSLARRAEVNAGLDADVVVLAPGGVVVAGVLLAVVAWSGHRALSSPQSSGPGGWPARVGRAVRWTGPAAGVGVTMALDPGRGRRSVPARSALLGALLGVAGVIAAGVFVNSVETGRHQPARYGWTWDAQPDLAVEDPETVVARMVEDPDLSAVAVASCGPLRVDDRPLYGCSFDDWKGSTGAPVTAGRPPTGPNEVALGRVTMEQLGVSIGDTVRVSTGAALSVVGQAVIPPLDNTEPGQGAILTTKGLETARETGGGRYLLLTYAHGADHAELEQRLEADYGATFPQYSGPEAPGTLIQLAAMTGLLVALGVFLAGLGIAGLVHFLAVSVRRRRRDFAVLRSLGFVRRDVGFSVSSQAVTVAALGVLAGIPLGVIVGRWAWLAAIRSVGMIDTPSMPLGQLALVACAAVGGAAVLGVVPGWLAARRRPADGLRSE